MLKTADGQWLQDKSTGKDFYFHPSAPTRQAAQTTEEVTRAVPESSPVHHSGITPQNATKPSTSHPPSAMKQQLSQEERNRLELPDITKGVPWRPHEAPVIVPTEPGANEAIDMTAVTGSPWSPPAGLMDGFTEGTIQVGIPLSCLIRRGFLKKENTGVS